MPLSSLVCNPRNPRDADDDVAELAASITQVGLLQPLGVVRYEVYLARYPEHETTIGSAHWVVIHGNRRVAAARTAGLTEVPVVVQERLGRENSFDESVLIENIHRKDLPPLREAALLQELIEKHGSGRKVAAAVGKTSGWVTQRLSLLKLVPQLQALLAGGDLSIFAARELAQIPSTRQLEAFERGAPYRDPAKPPPVPNTDVVAGDTSSYAKTDLDQESAYGVSTRDATPKRDSVPESAYGVSTRDATPKRDSVPESAYGVSTRDATPKRDSVPESAYGVSTQPAGDTSPQQSGHSDDELVSILRAASAHELVRAIRVAYSAEQYTEIGRQLQA